MRLLRAKFDVETRFGGRFVQEIDGPDGRGRRAARRDWFFFVNGVEAERRRGRVRALARRPRAVGLPRLGGGDARAGDRGRVPRAVPERGEGERRPVRVECEDAESGACRDAKDALDARACRCPASSLGAPGTEHVTRLVVARWPRARIVRGGRRSRRGRRRAACSRASRRRPLARAARRDGEVARTVRAGDGTALVAALRPRDDELVWLVTALDEQGGRGRRAGAREDRCATPSPSPSRAYGGGLPLGPMSLIPVYRSRPSALHAARAGVGAAFCCAFALVGALYPHPLILAARWRRSSPRAWRRGWGGRSAARCGWRCRSRCCSRWSTRSSTRRATRCSCAAATSRLAWRHDPRGAVAGAMTGLRIVVLIARAGRPDVGRRRPRRAAQGLRRVSYRSALTAVAGHSARAGARPRRRAHGRRRPLPAAAAGRLAVARAAMAGSLDRAVDVAAALEVRGYSPAGGPRARAGALVAPRPAHRRGGARARPWRSPGAVAGVGPGGGLSDARRRLRPARGGTRRALVAAGPARRSPGRARAHGGGAC